MLGFSIRTKSERNKKEKEIRNMSNRKTNQPVVPQAREALDKFKMEAANEVGVNLKQGYNGDLTSREAGSVGGQMVKNVSPIRTTKRTRKCRTTEGHEVAFTYRCQLGI